MALFILALILFIIFDILIRYIGRKMQEKKALKERENVLNVSLQLDYSMEAKTLKRAEVKDQKAKILCVDDEPVILDSFRKILVLDGYSVDTVENGKDALGLIQKHHYDFVFTDLKMPIMDGIDVTKAVKHLRPDIDVIIITGYATVETAVECMKFGAMDYVQKPFTEDELLAMVKKILIKRQDKIQKQLRPSVQITHRSSPERTSPDEFSIPGGVFISPGHCWASIEPDGTVKVGLDDFAKKLIGKIDSIEFPNLGMTVQKGQTLFIAKQNLKLVPFRSPISGKISKLNTYLMKDLDSLNINPYDSNWICVIDADNIETELKDLKIGKEAVTFYESDIINFKNSLKNILKDNKIKSDLREIDKLYIGELEHLQNKDWDTIVHDFFNR